MLFFFFFFLEIKIEKVRKKNLKKQKTKKLSKACTLSLFLWTIFRQWTFFATLTRTIQTKKKKKNQNPKPKPKYSHSLIQSDPNWETQLPIPNPIILLHWPTWQQEWILRLRFLVDTFQSESVLSSPSLLLLPLSLPTRTLFPIHPVFYLFRKQFIYLFIFVGKLG